MQRETIDLHSGRKGVHAVHDFEALHDFDELHAHFRTDDRNVMGRKERPRPRLVNVVHETRYDFIVRSAMVNRLDITILRHAVRHGESDAAVTLQA